MKEAEGAARTGIGSRWKLVQLLEERKEEPRGWSMVGQQGRVGDEAGDVGR